MSFSVHIVARMGREVKEDRMHYKPKFPWAYVALLLIALSGFCLLHARQPSDAWLISIGFMMGLLAATLAVWVAVRFGD